MRVPHLHVLLLVPLLLAAQVLAESAAKQFHLNPDTTASSMPPSLLLPQRRC